MIIDRFESEFAVIEIKKGNKVIIPKILLPAEAKEGDTICITIDTEGTAKREAVLRNKLNGLFED